MPTETEPQQTGGISRVTARERSIGTLLVALLLSAVVTVSVTGGRSFWDDEIFTLRLIDAAGGQAARIIAIANSQDVHPPLGYLLTNALHQALGDWQAVKLVSGLVNAAAVALLAWCAAALLPRKTWWIAVMLLASGASAVMWGASLRWYAWFHPLYWSMFAVLAFRAPSVRQAAWLLSAGGAALFAINYLAVLAVPPLGLLAAWRLRAKLDRRAALEAISVLAAGLIVCIPQTLVMIEIHLPYQWALQGHISAVSGLQILATAGLGNGVFPLQWLPLAWLAALSASALWAFVRRDLPDWFLPLLATLACTALLLFVTGAGRYPRHAMFLYPLAILPSAAVLAELSLPWRLAACLLGAAFQAQGTVNVALHRDTAKISFNMPYAQAVETVRGLSRGCRRTVLVHHDVVLTYQFEQLSLPQISAYHADGGDFFYRPVDPPPRYALRPGDCVIGIETAASAEQDAWYTQTLAVPQLRANMRRKLGRDDYAGFKSRLAGTDFKADLIVLTRYAVVAPLQLEQRL